MITLITRCHVVAEFVLREPDGGVCRIKLTFLAMFSSFLKRRYLRERKGENFCNERGNLASGIIEETAAIKDNLKKKIKKEKFYAFLNTNAGRFYLLNSI